MLNLITQTRYGVPETNSSSSHSMCISTKPTDNTVDIDRDTFIDRINGAGVWKVNGDNEYYERGPVALIETFSQKARYLLAWFSNVYCDSENIKWRDNCVNDIISIIQKYIPELKSIEFTGKYEKGFGYVRNSGLIQWMEKNSITFEEFLTNKKYFVIVDGDEHNIFTGMADLGMIDSAIRITTSWDG